MKKKNKEELRKQAFDLIEKIGPFMERFKELSEIKNPNAEEVNELKKLGEMAKKALPVLEQLASYFGESAYGQAVAIYYHAKELAARGDKEAQKTVDELGPLYKEALKERMQGDDS